MTLETPRLRLTPLRPGDEHRLWRFLSDPVTMWAWNEPYSYNKLSDWIGWSQEAEQAFGLGRHLLRLKATGEVVGDCGFFPWDWQDRTLIDAGWIIGQRHWRQGYAVEAMRALLPALFARGHRAAWARMAWNNEPSRRTAQALGFQPAGSVRYAPIRWDRVLLWRLEG